MEGYTKRSEDNGVKELTLFIKVLFHFIYLAKSL